MRWWLGLVGIGLVAFFVRRTGRGGPMLQQLTGLLQAPMRLLGAGQRATPITIQSGKYQRRYDLYVPKKLKQPAQLVITLHGSGGNAYKPWQNIGWERLADQEGFVVAFAEGMQIPGDPSAGKAAGGHWNRGLGKRTAEYLHGDWDDIQFLHDVIADASRRVAIDQKRLYMVGFSGGAGMTYRFAADTNVLAGFAATNGTIGQYGDGVPLVIDGPQGRKDLGCAILIHGEKDAWAGGVPANKKGVGGWKGQWLPTADAEKLWKDALGATTAAPLQVPVPARVAHKWVNPSTGQTVIMYVDKGRAHVLPRQWSLPRWVWAQWQAAPGR